MDMLTWCARQASIFADPNPNLRLHVQGVVRKATWAAGALNALHDREYLVALALVHDLAKGTRLSRTGVHQVDIASYLLETWEDQRLTALAGHHSGSRFEIPFRSQAIRERFAEFQFEDSEVSRVFVWCDVTVNGLGQDEDPIVRLDSLVRRSANDLAVVQAVAAGRQYILDCIVFSERLFAENNMCWTGAL